LTSADDDWTLQELAVVILVSRILSLSGYSRQTRYINDNKPGVDVGRVSPVCQVYRELRD